MLRGRMMMVLPMMLVIGCSIGWSFGGGSVSAFVSTTATKTLTGTMSKPLSSSLTGLAAAAWNSDTNYNNQMRLDNHSVKPQQRNEFSWATDLPRGKDGGFSGANTLVDAYDRPTLTSLSRETGAQGMRNNRNNANNYNYNHNNNDNANTDASTFSWATDLQRGSDGGFSGGSTVPAFTNPSVSSMTTASSSTASSFAQQQAMRRFEQQQYSSNNNNIHNNHNEINNRKRQQYNRQSSNWAETDSMSRYQDGRYMAPHTSQFERSNDKSFSWNAAYPSSSSSSNTNNRRTTTTTTNNNNGRYTSPYQYPDHKDDSYYAVSASASESFRDGTLSSSSSSSSHRQPQHSQSPWSPEYNPLNGKNRNRYNNMDSSYNNNRDYSYFNNNNDDNLFYYYNDDPNGELSGSSPRNGRQQQRPFTNTPPWSPNYYSGGKQNNNRYNSNNPGSNSNTNYFSNNNNNRSPSTAAAALEDVYSRYYSSSNDGRDSSSWSPWPAAFGDDAAYPSRNSQSRKDGLSSSSNSHDERLKRRASTTRVASLGSPLQAHQYYAIAPPPARADKYDVSADLGSPLQSHKFSPSAYVSESYYGYKNNNHYSNDNYSNNFSYNTKSAYNNNNNYEISSGRGRRSDSRQYSTPWKSSAWNNNSDSVARRRQYQNERQQQQDSSSSNRKGNVFSWATELQRGNDGGFTGGSTFGAYGNQDHHVDQNSANPMADRLMRGGGRLETGTSQLYSNAY